MKTVQLIPKPKPAATVKSSGKRAIRKCLADAFAHLGVSLAVIGSDQDSIESMQTTSISSFWIHGLGQPKVKFACGCTSVLSNGGNLNFILLSCYLCALGNRLGAQGCDSRSRLQDLYPGLLRIHETPQIRPTGASKSIFDNLWLSVE